MALTLPDTANLGDPGHINDHNLITTALGTLETDLAAKAAYPSGGTNGNALIKSGTTTAWGSAGGLVFIVSGTVAAGSSLTLNNCFSASYANYRILLESNVAPTLRWRVGGADNSASAYYEQSVYGNGATVGAVRSGPLTSAPLPSGVPVAAVLDVFQPAVATPTVMTVLANQGAVTAPSVIMSTHGHNVSTAFDGFSILGTTMTASVRVYGYANS
jgi:hypothetical protein